MQQLPKPSGSALKASDVERFLKIRILIVPKSRTSDATEDPGQRVRALFICLLAPKSQPNTLALILRRSPVPSDVSP